MFPKGFINFMEYDASIFVYLLWVTFRLDYEGITSQVAGDVESGAYNQALQVCNGAHHPMTEIMKAALVRANRPEKEMRRGVEVVAMEEVSRFKGNTHLLPHVSNIATLLGLMGTIKGLITSFAGLSSGDAAARTEILSRGVSEAFTATFFGILTATITITGFLFLFSKQGKSLHKIEYGVATVVDAILTKQAEIRYADAPAPARSAR
jgi:biopolymer transport protein ExbB